MKTKRALRRLSRIRVIAGCALVAAVLCAEVWMVCRFGSDCARAVAAEVAPVMPGLDSLVAAR